MSTGTGNLKTLADQIRGELNEKFLFGSSDLLDQLIVAYLAKGHVLIEGPPGTAKTLCVKLLAKVLSKTFSRIQFTSDMLPGDILGAHIYSAQHNSFEFIKGPIFANFILADEINRTPPRTQSALLEVMEERQITSEGKVLKLDDDFFVIATQNPQDYEGTFPLPEVQLDRFLFKLTTNHSNVSTEIEILENIISGVLPPKYDEIRKVEIDWESIEQEIKNVKVDRSILEYIARILESTRSNPLLIEGTSIRGGISLVKSARVLALLRSRNFVIPDDVKELAKPTLSHRIKLSSDAALSQNTENQVIDEIISNIPFPT